MAGASASAIKAGEAYVEVFADNSRLRRVLKDSGARLKKFGARLATLGVSGAGVLGAALVKVSERTAKIRGQFRDLNDKELKAVLRTTDLMTSRYGVDLPKQLEALRTITTNFGVDVEEALDILAAGFERGLNVSDDFLDTMQEYSSEFAELGLSADDALGILNRGLENGARNTDVVADAVKEFGILIREADTAKKIEEIDPAMAKVVRAFQEGKITGKQALGEITDGLGNVTDTTARTEAGVALFGTKWEDMSEQAVLAIGDITTGVEGTAGAAEKAGERIATLGEVFTKLRSKLDESLVPVNTWLIETLNNLPQFASEVMYGLETLGIEINKWMLKTNTAIWTPVMEVGGAIEGIVVYTINGIRKIIQAAVDNIESLLDLLDTLDKYNLFQHTPLASKAREIRGNVRETLEGINLEPLPEPDTNKRIEEFQRERDKRIKELDAKLLQIGQDVMTTKKFLDGDVSSGPGSTPAPPTSKPTIREQKRREQEQKIVRASNPNALNSASILGTTQAANDIARALSGSDAAKLEKRTLDEIKKQTGLLKDISKRSGARIGAV